MHLNLSLYHQYFVLYSKLTMKGHRCIAIHTYPSLQQIELAYKRNIFEGEIFHGFVMFSLITKVLYETAVRNMDKIFAVGQTTVMSTKISP